MSPPILPGTHRAPFHPLAGAAGRDRRHGRIVAPIDRTARAAPARGGPDGADTEPCAWISLQSTGARGAAAPERTGPPWDRARVGVAGPAGDSRVGHD
ncbi:hypothetical protein GCM10020229_43950 [Kitasatospora albolonga]